MRSGQTQRLTFPQSGNQDIAEPTLFYLERLARRSEEGGKRFWRDLEGNVLWRS
jgi:hypothetical protein